jgi:hydroxyacyl-ACP dehydratase HTD2-like protein with hotdog domain
MMEAAWPLKHWLTSTRLHSATTQKTEIFILTAVKTSNPTTKLILIYIYLFFKSIHKPF